MLTIGTETAELAINEAAAEEIAGEARHLVGAPPPRVARWFGRAMDLAIPANDGTIEGQRRTADAIRRHAKAINTIKAYRSGVKAWCAYAEHHAVQALPAHPNDIKAFLVDQREPLPPAEPVSFNTLKLRVAAIAYMHALARLDSPSRAIEVIETLTGYRRTTDEVPLRKHALRIDLLAQVLEPIGREKLVDLRDRAILLIGFAGALRRSELAKLDFRRVEVLETSHRRGLRIRLPRSKGDRAGTGVTIVIPAGQTELCPLSAYKDWIAAAGITEGPVFRRIRPQPRPKMTAPGWIPSITLGDDPIDDGTIARVVKARVKAVGIDPADFSGHSLKRGALNTADDRNVNPKAIKQLGRHKSYAALEQYLEEREAFEDGALKGVY